MTTHPAAAGTLGRAASTAHMEGRLRSPGPVVVERIVSAEWAVPLDGLLNLDDPKAAGIVSRDEPIEIYMYAIRHPVHGTFIVDAGVGAAFADGEETIASWIIESAMNLEALKVRQSTAAWLAEQSSPINGVFLTHLHLDHILGLPDVPRGTPIFVGPGEAEASRFLNMFVQGTTDRALDGHDDLHTWSTTPDPSGVFDAVVDVFGDGSFFAVHVPGHTPGSMAFVAVTATGPVLLVGDTCHTAWGWDHGVEPGEFTEDHAANRKNLEALRALAARHPSMTVHLGHQPVSGANPEAHQHAAHLPESSH